MQQDRSDTWDGVSGTSERPGMVRDPGAPPLVVDMDGTLLRTDSLWEGVVSVLVRRPASGFRALFTVLRGRAALKACIAGLADIDVDTLPVNLEFVSYIEAQKAAGRAMYLVTAANHGIAQKIAERFDLFDAVEGSTSRLNLKGSEKLEAIRRRCPDGFAYAGDSRADLEVWRAAKSAILVNAPKSVADAVKHSGTPIEAEFPAKGVSTWHWWSALRTHQWAKNLLIFVPLFLSHSYVDARSWAASILGFVCLSIVASGTYIINDLTDLVADRKHNTKKSRPFASGAMPIMYGFFAAPALIVAGFVTAILLSPAFAACLGGYLVLTLTYSMALKSRPIVDVFALAALYTLRVAMGSFVLGVVLSPWLLTFSTIFFLSLSLAKRHVEVINAGAEGKQHLHGRGYFASDWPLTLSVGIAAAFSSVIVLVLYLVDEAFPSGVYSNTAWLWAMPGIVLLWTMRIWLEAHRGSLNDDPVLFAIRDPLSLGLFGLAGIAFLAAVL